jgi:hypothetical protein
MGYFKQAFGIRRPFHFDSPTEPLFSTQSYYYLNLQFYGGVGYRKELDKNMFIKGEITYNELYSFRQKYFLNKKYKTWQVNKKSMPIGGLINFNIGAEKSITKKVSIGIDALLPISTSWNNDDIFIEYGYSDDTQQIARNKFSIGTAISCNFNF